MTEHNPNDAFETRLTALVRSYTEPAAKPSDPLITARRPLRAVEAMAVLAIMSGSLGLAAGSV